eukprot:g13587.t1
MFWPRREGAMLFRVPSWKQRDHEHLTQDSTPFDKFYDAKEKATMRVVFERQFYIRYLKTNGKKCIEDMDEMMKWRSMLEQSLMVKYKTRQRDGLGGYNVVNARVDGMKFDVRDSSISVDVETGASYIHNELF